MILDIQFINLSKRVGYYYISNILLETLTRDKIRHQIKKNTVIKRNYEEAKNYEKDENPFDMGTMSIENKIRKYNTVNSPKFESLPSSNKFRGPFN